MNLLDILFPVKCPVCGRILKGKKEWICRVCRAKLPRVTEPVCLRCGKPIESDTRQYCRDCSRKRDAACLGGGHIKTHPVPGDPIRQGTALWVYTESTKRIMADLKYNGCYRTGPFLAEELVRFRGGRIRQWQPDYVIPVPMHRRKRWFRGYNQTACVAEELGKRMHVPVITDALVRSRYTRPQKGFDDKLRRDNVKDAFRLQPEWKEKIQDSRVLLVDDIYTTGATLESCASVLCEAGVKYVYFVCLCTGRNY